MLSPKIPLTLALCAMLATSARPLHAQMQKAPCDQMPAKPDVSSPSTLPAPQRMTGIGNVHFKISSKNSETQAWFDQGINLSFDFWDYEAQRAFEQAVRTDPNCAICHWALYESLSFTGESGGYAHDELSQAIALRSHADKRENLYIDAAEAEEKAALAAGHSGDADNSAANAILRQIVQKYHSDLVAQMLLAQAVQDGYDDGKPRKGTQESILLLKGVLRIDPNNSAAQHLWIHAVEASPHPEQALDSAKMLASLAPNSGHMTHMPGHIFYRTGDYAQAQVSFDLSESVDEAYMRAQNVSVDDDWNYVHNLMYSIANLVEEGHMEQAAIVSQKLGSARGSRASTLYPWSTRDSIARLDPQLPVALRSGDWPRVQKLLATAHPPDSLPNLQLLARTLTAFAQGMQKAQENDLDGARKASETLDAELWRASQRQSDEETAEKKQAITLAKPVNRPTPTDPVLKGLVKNVAIMSLELRAAILADENKIPDAEKLFAQARREEQDLGYREPPAFIQPVAEQEAAVMLAAGHIAEARAAWQHALEDRPKSGFPLFGMAVTSENSGTADQTATAYREFLAAWKTADPDLPQVKHAEQWMTAHETQSASVK